MKKDKPVKLIELLNDLKKETDKTKYGSIFLSITKETMSLEFEHNIVAPFQGLVYKKLIRLTVKDYIANQTEESLKDLNELIEMLGGTFVLIT